MHVNIRFLTRSGMGEPIFTSYVKEVQGDFADFVPLLFKFGFKRQTSKNLFPDEEEVVAPGAIMSVVPCNERGWSRHDLEQLKEDEVRRMQERGKW